MAETFGEVLKDIPNWLLLHVSQPTGRRMPPLKKWHEGLYYGGPTNRDRRGNYVPYIWPAPEVKEAPQAAAPKSYKHMGVGNWKTGNLQENEYPFWVGEKEPLGTWARCRWCGESQVASTRESRWAHQKEDHCTKNLRLVYKLALQPSNMLCVQCGNSCSRARWGMPLCSMACDNDFRFHLVMSTRMHILRQRAREQQFLYPMVHPEWEERSRKQV